MKVTQETLDYVAHLSRLQVQDDEREGMLESMNSILDWMNELNELDTTGVAPLYHMTENTNSLREDEVRHALPREQALANAPQQDGTFFRVPKVVG